MRLDGPRSAQREAAATKAVGYPGAPGEAALSQRPGRPGGNFGAGR